MFFYYMFTSLMFTMMSMFFLIIGMLCLKFNFFILMKISLMNLIFIDMNFYILLDWISSMFMFIVFFISSMVIMYSYMYMLNDKKSIKFLILMILFVLSMNFLVICPNLMISILGWDGLGLISFCLIIFYNNEISNYSGVLTVMTNRLGDIGLILSIILMLNNFSWDMKLFMLKKNYLYFIIFFLLLAATTKSAQLPFSSWLPAAMAAPTPVSSLVHSSTLVTAGIYLIIRMFMYFSNNFFSEMLMICSILTMFLAGISALFEMDMKKIIALSTLSQLGVMMMILSSKNFELAIFHLLTHAMFKACLFLCAGAIIHSCLNWQDVRHISLMSSLSPSITSSLIITNLSLMGFPFLSGFYSKDLILEYMYMNNNSFMMLMLIIISTMLTSIYSLRLMMFLCKNENFLTLNNFHDNKFINLPIMILSFLVIFLGNFLSWMMFSSPMLFFFNKIIKLINLMIFIMSVYLFYNYFYKYKTLSFFSFSSFLGKMWFTENSGLLITPFFYISKFMSKNLESWIEMSSSKIFILEMEKMNIYFNKIMMNKMFNFLKLTFILILLMLIF